MAGGVLDVVEEARRTIGRDGVDALTLDDLRLDDLDDIAWSGEPRHRVAVGEALARVSSGDVDYLAVRVPSGHVVAMVGIDFIRHPGAGYLWQFVTHPALQGKGIGSALVAGAEARIAARGLTVARLNVERDNLRARSLYERLGYSAIGEDTETWERVGDDGAVTLHRADVTLMAKRLS